MYEEVCKYSKINDIKMRGNNVMPCSYCSLSVSYWEWVVSKTIRERYQGITMINRSKARFVF